MKKTILMLSSLFVLGATSFAQTTTWNLDKAHATLGFAVDHMVVSETQGKFAEFDVQLQADKADFTDAKISASVKVASVNTENKMRDEHLAGADFFEAEKFPTIEFKGLQLKKNKNGSYQAIGDVTIKGVTKKITFDVKFGGVIKDPQAYGGKTRAGFKLNGKINREDFGLKYNSVLDGGGVAIGKEVRINAALEFTK